MGCMPVIGQTFCHYRIVERIGAGGMGEVYRATDTKLGRDVALKVLPEAFARNPERMARFRHDLQRHVAIQLRITSAIDHSHSARAERRDDLIRTKVCSRT